MIPGMGKRIREARDAKNLTQTELANALGVQRQTVSNMERERSDPSATILKQMCLVTERSGDFFLGLQMVVKESIGIQEKETNKEDACSCPAEGRHPHNPLPLGVP